MKIDVPWVIRGCVNFMQFTTQPESMKIWQDRGFLEVLFSAIVYPWPLLFFGWQMFGAAALIFVLMSVCSQLTHRLFLNIILFECQCAAYVFMRMKKNTKAIKARYCEMAVEAGQMDYAFDLWRADPKLFFFALLYFRRTLYRQSREGALYPKTICLLTRIDTVHFVLGVFRVLMMFLFWFVQLPGVLECLSMCCECAWSCLAVCMTWIVDVLHMASGDSPVLVDLTSRAHETYETYAKMYANLIPKHKRGRLNVTQMRKSLQQDEESADMKQDTRIELNVTKKSSTKKVATRIPTRLNITQMRRSLEQDEESDEADTSTDE